MMQRRIGTGVVFLGASGRGVSKAVAVGAFGIAVSLCPFLALKPLGE